MKQLHVVPRGDGWAVKRVGLRISELFDNKPDAIEHAQKLAKASGTEWVEYRRTERSATSIALRIATCPPAKRNTETGGRR